MNMRCISSFRSRVILGPFICILGITTIRSPVNCFSLHRNNASAGRALLSSFQEIKHDSSRRIVLRVATNDEDILTLGSTKRRENSHKNVEERMRAAETAARAIHDNDVMNALFVDVPEYPDPIPCMIRNERTGDCSSSSSLLPSDLPRGCLLRIGPNTADSNMGFLDGDGMVHCVTLPPTSSGGGEDTIMYSCTYVQTKGRTLEEKVNTNQMNKKGADTEPPTKKVFQGTLGAAPQGLPMLASLLQNGLSFGTMDVQKDTCNTALAVSGNRVLALMEQSPPSELNITQDGRVYTHQAFCRLDGAIPPGPINGGSFGAHGRTDPATHERIHVSYSSNAPPFIRVDTFENNWKLQSSIGVDVPAPVMMHDCAITARHVVLLDFPLTIRPRRFLRNAFPVEYEPSNGARIGLVARHNSREGEANDSSSAQWFDVESGVVLHAINAYERIEDGNVVVHGFKSIPKGTSSYILDYTPAFLYEWVLDPTTGTCVQEGCLNPDLMVEFPQIEEKHTGQPVTAVYGLTAKTIGGPLHYKTPQVGVVLDGIAKLALEDDFSNDIVKGDLIDRFDLPSGWHMVSETTVVSKTGDKSGHYILGIATYVPPIQAKGDNRKSDYVTLARDGTSMKSQLLVLDGDNLLEGPVATVDLPHHVNYGLHSMFLEWGKMQNAENTQDK